MSTRVLLLLAVLAALGRSLPAQAPTGGHAIGCDLCHGSHVGERAHAGRLVMTTRADAAGPAVVTPPGLSRTSLSCLRCHYSSAVRAKEMKPDHLAQTGGQTGGRYIGPALQTGHRTAGNGTPECTTCHRVHVRGQLLPEGTRERAICSTCHPAQANHPDERHLTTACSGCHPIHSGTLATVAATPRRTGDRSPLLSRSARDRAPRTTTAQPISAAAGARSPLDAACLSCHMTTSGVRVERMPGAQVNLAHAMRGSCVGCHMRR